MLFSLFCFYLSIMWHALHQKLMLFAYGGGGRRERMRACISVSVLVCDLITVCLCVICI